MTDNNATGDPREALRALIEAQLPEAAEQFTDRHPSGDRTQRRELAARVVIDAAALLLENAELQREHPEPRDIGSTPLRRAGL